MKQVFEHDVFISYRRKGGAELARLLFAELERKGYRVFLDVEGLGEGHFDERLLRVIEGSRNVVAVLSVGCLDRCALEDDWMRLELAHAIKTRRHIIPVMVPGFAFPAVSELPAELHDLPRHQSIPYDHVLFGATLAKLCEMLGRPGAPASLPVSLRRFRVALTGLASGVLAGLALLCAWLGGCLKGQLYSEADKTLLRGLATDMGSQLGAVNTELGNVGEAAKRARTFFAAPQDAQRAGPTNDYSAWLQFRLREMDRIKMASLWRSDDVPRLQRLRLPAEDAHAWYETGLPLFWSETRKFYSDQLFYAQMPPIGWPKSLGRAAELAAECLSLNAETMYYGAIGFLSHFPPDALGDFEKLRPQLTRLPDSGLLNEKEADLRSEKALNKYQERAMELAALLGKEEQSAEELEKRVDLLRQKEAGVAEMKKALDGFTGQLAAAQSRLGEKCRLNEDDSPALMWGKILQLQLAGMTNEVFQSMDRYLRLRKDDPQAASFIAGGRAFYQSPAHAACGAGVLVANFENGKPHSSLKVGDVLLSMNGFRLRTGDDFVAAPSDKSGKGNVFSVLRLSADGRLQEVTCRSRPDDPRVGVADLRGGDAASGNQ